MSKIYILHNTNAENLLKNGQKNCPKNNKVTYPFLFQTNLSTFQISYEFFNFFLRFWKTFWKMNVMLRNSDMFLYQDSISHTKIFWMIELTIARL